LFILTPVSIVVERVFIVIVQILEKALNLLASEVLNPGSEILFLAWELVEILYGNTGTALSSSTLLLVSKDRKRRGIVAVPP